MNKIIKNIHGEDAIRHEIVKVWNSLCDNYTAGGPMDYCDVSIVLAGSEIAGSIVAIGSKNQNPAIRIREKKTGNIIELTIADIEQIEFDCP